MRIGLFEVATEKSLVVWNQHGPDIVGFESDFLVYSSIRTRHSQKLSISAYGG